MRAMPVIVAGGRRIHAAATAVSSGVDGIVPVVVVVGRRAIPAAVLALQRGVIPLVAGVLPADHDPLAGEARGPHIRRVDFGDVPLDGVRLGRGLEAGSVSRLSDRLVHVYGRVGVDVRHVPAQRQRLYVRHVPAHPDHVRDPEGPILQAAAFQFPEQRRLRAFRRGGEGGIDVFALLGLFPQARRLAQVGLLGQKDQEFGLSGVCRFQHPGVNLRLPGRDGRGSTGAVADAAHHHDDQSGEDGCTRDPTRYGWFQCSLLHGQMPPGTSTHRVRSDRLCCKDTRQCDVRASPDDGSSGLRGTARFVGQPAFVV